MQTTVETTRFLEVQILVLAQLMNLKKVDSNRVIEISREANNATGLIELSYQFIEDMFRGCDDPYKTLWGLIHRMREQIKQERLPLKIVTRSKNSGRRKTDSIVVISYCNCTDKNNFCICQETIIP